MCESGAYHFRTSLGRELVLCRGSFKGAAGSLPGHGTDLRDPILARQVLWDMTSQGTSVFACSRLSALWRESAFGLGCHPRLMPEMIADIADQIANGCIRAYLIGDALAVPTSGSGASAVNALSQKGINLLEAIESLRLKPYDDQTGKEISQWVQGATIGYGHLIGKSEWALYKNGITKAKAEQVFKSDLSPFEKAVNDAITVKVSQQQFDAMVILAFNIGVNAFKNSSVAKLVNNSKAKTSYKTLEDAWKVWNKSQGKVSNGLKNRRNAEWNIYTKGVYKQW